MTTMATATATTTNTSSAAATEKTTTTTTTNSSNAAASAATASNSRILSPEQLEQFERDGFLIVRGILNETDLQEARMCGLDIANQGRKGPYFHSIVKGAMYSHEAFQKIALHSKLPQIAAELMQLSPQSQTLRILRDVFLAKEVNNQETCGWHVDDQAFWPESYISEASEASGIDQSGINAWIALDDMPREYEGSMAIAKQSHKASWRWQAYQAIGQDRTRTWLSKEELLEAFQHMATKGTCRGVEHAPDLQAQLDAQQEIADLKIGDVILASRLTFHRTMPVTPEGQEYFASMQKEQLMRYSIRYVPGTARLVGGLSGEWSSLVHPSYKGKTLDEIEDNNNSDNDTQQKETEECWYPLVWPQHQDNFVGVPPSIIQQAKEEEAKIYAEMKLTMSMNKEASKQQATP